MGFWHNLNMDTPTTTLNTSSLAMRVLLTTPEAVYVRLPRELQLAAVGDCSCGHCEGRPAWDTLVVPTDGQATFTAHMPDGAVKGFVLHMDRRYPGRVKARGLGL